MNLIKGDYGRRCTSRWNIISFGKLGYFKSLIVSIRVPQPDNTTIGRFSLLSPWVTILNCAIQIVDRLDQEDSSPSTLDTLDNHFVNRWMISMVAVRLYSSDRWFLSDRNYWYNRGGCHRDILGFVSFSIQFISIRCCWGLITRLIVVWWFFKMCWVWCSSPFQ